MTAFTCGYCGRPCASFVWLGDVPYHEECTHGPDYRRSYYGGNVSDWAKGVAPLSEQDVRRIVREEIERLKDQIEGGLGVRP